MELAQGKDGQVRKAIDIYTTSDYKIVSLNVPFG
jgi:hypothetical protein